MRSHRRGSFFNHQCLAARSCSNVNPQIKNRSFEHLISLQHVQKYQIKDYSVSILLRERQRSLWFYFFKFFLGFLGFFSSTTYIFYLAFTIHEYWSENMTKAIKDIYRYQNITRIWRACIISIKATINKLKQKEKK